MYVGLSIRYMQCQQVQLLTLPIYDDTVSIPEEDQEIIRILRNAVQDYRETWDKDQS